MNSRTLVLIFAAVLLFFICFFTARMYIYGFKVSSHPARGVIAIALIMPIVYMGSLFGATKANRVGKAPYTMINVLAGLFFYLFLGGVVLGITSIGFLIAGSTIPLSIAWIILILSLLAALAGFIQAKRIVVTHYDVVLPNAPASWNGKTAAMISDTHFGLVNYTGFADKIVNKLLSLNPDIVLHAG